MSGLTHGHTVNSFDQEMTRLDADLQRLGEMTLAQMGRTIQAVEALDGKMAKEVIHGDQAIDELEEQVRHNAFQIIAKRQPIAADLRYVIGAMRSASDMERMADLTENVAKRLLSLVEADEHPVTDGLVELARRVMAQVEKIIQAEARDDVGITQSVWLEDREIDQLYNELVHETMQRVGQDPRQIQSSIHLLSMAKGLERIGDLATNVAENLYFMIVGKPLRGIRPQVDETGHERGIHGVTDQG